MLRKWMLVGVLLAFLASSVAAQDEDEDATLPFEDITLTVLTYDSFVLDPDVQAAFEAETGIKLEIVRLSDAGAMVNQAILTKDNPLADVMYGIDNTFLGRALAQDLFVSYEADGLDEIPEAFRLDNAENRVTPVTFGDVCLNYDRAYFEDNDLPLPETLADLTDPQYEDLLVVQNPATSSPGLAFLLATIAAFGDDEDGDYSYLDFWQDLKGNGVLVVPGWVEAYYESFTLAGGDRPLVVSYASSPPAEVLFGEMDVEDAPTGAIVADGTCFRQVEFAGILDGTENEAAAQRFIDFLIDLPFQESLPLTMFVFPVNPDAQLPDLFEQMVDLPEVSAVLDTDAIDAGREDWIEAWTDVMLR